MSDNPVCAVCKREVDEMMTYRDEIARCDVYVVRCHGAEQRVELSDTMRLDITSITIGQAFLGGTT